MKQLIIISLVGQDSEVIKDAVLYCSCQGDQLITAGLSTGKQLILLREALPGQTKAVVLQAAMLYLYNLCPPEWELLVQRSFQLGVIGAGALPSMMFVCLTRTSGQRLSP